LWSRARSGGANARSADGVEVRSGDSRLDSLLHVRECPSDHVADTLECGEIVFRVDRHR
jgi:hypothetical protein